MFLFRKNFLIAGVFLLLTFFFASERILFVRDFVISRTASFGSIFFRAGISPAGFLRGSTDSSRDDRTRLFADAAELISLRKENENLRSALRIENTIQKKVMPASVTGVGREVGDEYILIDKGSEEGVGQDFLVLGGEKLLVGRVIEVFSHASRVLLISSPQ